MAIHRAWRAMRFRIDHRARTRREARAHADYCKIRFTDVEELLESHFAVWSEPKHINRFGFEVALRIAGGRPQLIVETGTSAWGTDSTRLWDAYARTFGVEFWSVDLSPAPSRRLRAQTCERTHLVVGDSVDFLTSFARERAGSTVGMCYLDSWDLNWEDPTPAEIHGLNEWLAIAPLVGAGTVLMIDDSPASLEWVPEHLQLRGRELLEKRGYLPGKGSLIDKELANDPACEKVWHGYNSVYLFHAPPKAAHRTH